MTEAMLVEAAAKLGSAAILGVLLYVVIVRAGARIVAAQDRQVAALDRQVNGLSNVVVALSRIEAKIDHQLAIDRDRDRAAGVRRPPPIPGRSS